MNGHNTDIAYYNNLETKPFVGPIIMVLVLMALGIVGNLHVLFVYTFRMKATSHRIFIIALAILDLLSCTISMPFVIADMLHRLTFNAAVACRILRFFLYFFAGGSGYVILPIAADRYLKICRPFGWQISPQKAKLLCAVILVFCVFVYWPIAVLYGKSTVKTLNPNITGVSCYVEDSFKYTSYLAYWNGTMLILANLTVIGLAVPYFLIGKSVRKHVKSKNKLLCQGERNGCSRKSRPCSKRSQPLDNLNKPWKDKGYNKKLCIELNVFTVNNQFKEQDDGFSRTHHERIGYSNGKAFKNTDKGLALRITDVNAHVEMRKEEQIKPTDDSKIYFVCKSENEIDKIGGIKKCTDRNSVDIFDTITSEPAEQETVGEENSRRHREALRNLKRSKRTTQICFAITVLYFVTFIPHLTLQVITFTQENFVASLSDAGQTVYHIVWYSPFLNSMANCYVYGFFDKIFRNEVKKHLHF